MDILPPFRNSFYFFSSLSFLLMQNRLTPLHKKTLKGSFFRSVVCLQTRNQHLSPTAPNLWHFQNQHNTKCQADSLPLWVVLFPIFSPPQPPYLLRRKRENFCPENNNKKSHPDKKREFLYPCCLGTKVDVSRTNRTNLSSPTSSVLKWLSLFSFLFSFFFFFTEGAWERPQSGAKKPWGS